MLSVPGPGGLRWHWEAKHSDVVPGQMFVDTQSEGPFRSWRHEHRFTDVPGGSQLEDSIEFHAHAGTGWLADGMVQRQLARQFAWRHLRFQEDIARHRAAALPKMRILVTGATGLVGSSVVSFLTTGGHDVVRLRRGLTWDPAAARLDPQVFTGVDAVIHLAGAPVARRWTPAVRAEIESSRVVSTALLATVLAQLKKPPHTLIVASGIGAYGDAGERVCREGSPTSGDSFLAGVCRGWEAAADPARAAGIRTVHLRIGMVLANEGGALATMLPAFRAGLGGRIGAGSQWVSWIGRDDLVHIIHAALADRRLSGPVNAVAPRAIRQQDFAATLAAVLHRPSLAPLPAYAVTTLFGDMGRELLLSSCNAEPGRLSASGFRWMQADLRSALRWELGLG